jgi:nitroreductase
MENLLEAIKLRKSTRSFTTQHLDKTVSTELVNYIQQNKKGLINEQVEIELVETNTDSGKRLKIDYGMVKNNHSYLMGAVENKMLSRMNYGFLMETAILKATSLGISSCWIGYFDNEYFKKIGVINAHNIPALAIIGYAGKTPTFSKWLMQNVVKSSRRKEWSDLFFGTDAVTPLAKDIPNTYAHALEMLRRAPSAGNTQPWRVVFDKDKETFHFYKKPISFIYEKKGLHDIDLGIALSHFDIALKVLKVNGNWHIDNSAKPAGDKWVYMISWKREN